MSFTEDEIAYLRSHGLGRLATLGPDGQPDVVPVAVEFDGTVFWVGGNPEITGTRKFRNVAAGRHLHAHHLDHLVELEPGGRAGR